MCVLTAFRCHCHCPCIDSRWMTVGRKASDVDASIRRRKTGWWELWRLLLARNSGAFISTRTSAKHSWFNSSTTNCLYSYNRSDQTPAAAATSSLGGRGTTPDRQWRRPTTSTSTTTSADFVALFPTSTTFSNHNKRSSVVDMCFVCVGWKSWGEGGGAKIPFYSAHLTPHFLQLTYIVSGGALNSTRLLTYFSDVPRHWLGSYAPPKMKLVFLPSNKYARRTI